MNPERIKRLVWLTINCSYSHSSLALPLIHQAAQNVNGWEWSCMETTREEDSAAIAAEIAAKDCDLVAAALYLFNREKVFDVLKRVKVLRPSVRIAAGGPECLGEGGKVLLKDHAFLDAVFRGESEEAFRDYLLDFERLEKRRVILPEKGNAVYAGWQTSPVPACDPFFRVDKPFVQLETSRGCPMGCRYCTSSGVALRFRELDHVREELSILRDRGVREIRVLDRTFNVPQSRGASLLRMFREEFPEMRFHMEIHPQFLDEDLQSEFRNALPGQLHVEAGLQSLDASVQRAIGRRSDPALAYDGLRFLCSCPAFETHTDLLAGLPLQTLESLKRDIVALIRIHPGEIQLEVLKVLPGTPLRQDAAAYDVAFSPEPPYDVMRTGTMSAGDILEARRLSRLLDLFYNHEQLRPVFQTLADDAFLRLAGFIREENVAVNTLMDLKKRFLLLQRFFAPALPDVLAEQWLLAGYPPGEGPGEKAEIVRALPDGIECIQGAEKSGRERESRIRCLRETGRELYYVYNRAYQMNKPCAVFQKRNSSLG